MTQQGGPAGEQATEGPEGAQAGQRIAHIPHAQPWLRALPAISQPGSQAPTAPSRAAPELDKPRPPSCACNQTKRLAWGYPRSQAVPPQMVTHQPWQRKAPLLFRVQLAHTRVLSPDPRGHRLNWLLGSSLPALHPPHLTCTSPWDGLRGGAPGTGAGGVEFQEWAMEVGIEVAASEHPAGAA